MTPERIRQLIQSAVDRTGGTHTVDDVLSEVAKGALQLWVGKACIGVTEIKHYPRKTAIAIFLAAGEMAEFITLQPAIEAFGRGRAATRLEFHGRATKAVAKHCGWLRSGADFTPGWVMYIKDI